MSRVVETALFTATAGVAVLGASGMASAAPGADAIGAATDSPGVLSGNVVQGRVAPSGRHAAVPSARSFE